VSAEEILTWGRWGWDDGVRCPDEAEPDLSISLYSNKAPMVLHPFLVPAPSTQERSRRKHPPVFALYYISEIAGNKTLL
jgi:hypothetical protein